MSPRLTPHTLLHLLLSTHPGPSAAVTAIAVILGFGLGLPPGRLVALGIAVLLGQFSIGLSNDWLDADRDRRSDRRDKPVARGLVSTRVVAIAATSALGCAIIITALLSVPAMLAHLVLLAAGWSYNLGLKRTIWSAITYLLGFGALPTIVTLTHQPPTMAPWWMVAAAALLGLAAHFANALPDLDADQKTGVRGLPHRFPPRVSGIVIFAALVVSVTLVALGPGVPPNPLMLGAVALVLAIAALGIGLVWVRPPSRLLFQLVMLGALMVVAGLAASLSQTGG